MIKRLISELHFIKSRDPLPTVEIQVESLEGKGLFIGKIASSALTRFAASNPTSKATIYMYGTMSVNFHEQGWSEFLIVAGDKKALKVLGNAFSSLPTVKSRYSDYIAPSEGIKTFHVEDGLLWEPEDAATWYSASPAGVENTQASACTAAAANEDIEDDGGEWGNVTVGSELESDGSNSDAPIAGRAPEKPARYRAARSDASVASIRNKVEQIFGLPEGSVALCGPDGRALRGDAFIKTLRRRWENS